MKHPKRDMKRYTIVYYGINREPTEIEVEASQVVRSESLINFLDEYGEDGYVFYRSDIISYKEVKS